MIVIYDCKSVKRTAESHLLRAMFCNLCRPLRGLLFSNYYLPSTEVPGYYHSSAARTIKLQFFQIPLFH